MKKKIAILGSTGSIGTQALDVIRAHSDKFEAYILTAGSNADLLIKQAREFMPDAVVIAAEDKYQSVSDALADLPIKVYTGQQALCDVCQCAEVDMVLTAMVGFAGLRPTVSALRARKPIALANKETLVVAGEYIMAEAMKQNVPILPVDSEHSAIFQSLVGDEINAIEKILLTASGGPFRNFTAEQLSCVTPADALKHPNWSMGEKITIDSATMMNKGFEMIEACHLFSVKPQQVEVVVHPESIVHSAVQFEDGAVKAQLGVPDMKLPIQYAFSFPQRLAMQDNRLDLFKLQSLHFYPADMHRFPCLDFSYKAIEQGGNMPCIMNAANEVVNLAFRRGEIAFPRIAEIIGETMQRATFTTSPELDVYFESDRQARIIAAEMVDKCRC
jgi:1-deoxy-D-xylulose-5-phosphate reductoisomerase